jgi:glycerol-3-phosphate dehydrogenase
MNRDLQIAQLEATKEWDVCIIGGGATGLSTALDAASRGLKTILFDRGDLAAATSSRSTKLVHGGVRYLQQGNIRLVMDALKERGLLLKNAPDLVHNQQFVVPNYKWWEKPFYGIGLKIYDKMAGSLGLGPSRFLSKEETLELAPTLDPAGLKGGVVYHDGQFDDARLAISIAQAAVRHHAVVLNYFPVTALLKMQGKIAGVQVKNAINGRVYEVRSKTVINATGVFTDDILKMDTPGHERIVSPSQGIHLVVDREFLPGETAIMIPRTSDGRVLFAVPWHNKIILGTTDTPVDHISAEPVALQKEIDFILSHMGHYLAKDPVIADIKSVFAGLRPLVRGKAKRTAALSRDHVVTSGASGMITITGGKWTTCRKMAEDVMNVTIASNGLQAGPCKTTDLSLTAIGKTIPASLEDVAAADLAIWIGLSVREEMCVTIEDFLSRRTRQLVLDAAAAIRMAPMVAKLMSREFHESESWINAQINNFNQVAANYLPKQTFNY